MGIFGAIGKMAGTKIIEKVDDELVKKQNREQTMSYCKYIKNNLAHICQITVDLENETKTIVTQISSVEGVKLAFREKLELRKNKDKVNKNLKYMYLIRDFFNILAKNLSGLMLKNEELMLVIKFAPYFDDIPVLDVDDNYNDDSVVGAFKEVGKELRLAFVSSKKSQHILYLRSIYIGIHAKLQNIYCLILIVQ